MKQITLAVISDLHVGDARSRDLYPKWAFDPANDKRVDPNKVEDIDYIGIFEEFVRAKDLRADYLIVPGDVSNGGHPAQVVIASTAIQRCASALGVPEERIVFVPGNHDVDWSMIRDDDESGHYQSLRYSTFHDPSVVFTRVVDRSPVNLFNEPYFSVWEYPNLLVVGCNSAWQDGPRVKPSHGFVASEHLAILNDKLSAIEVHPDQLRLLLVHHHPLAYQEIGDHKDFSALQNAGALIDLLIKHEFDFIIHGHKHRPMLTPRHGSYGRFITVLCAGSFSARLYDGWEGQIGNQFHLVEIASRSADSVCGCIRSWAYLVNRGWVESKNDNGIPHIQPFGAHLAIDKLVETLHPLISAGVSQNGLLYWSEIVERFPELAHLSAQDRDLVLTKLKATINFRDVEHEHDIVLLRPKGVAT